MSIAFLSKTSVLGAVRYCCGKKLSPSWCEIVITTRSVEAMTSFGELPSRIVSAILI